VRASGDPIARSLSDRFRGVRTPTLQLSHDQIDDVIESLDGVRVAHTHQ